MGSEPVAKSVLILTALLLATSLAGCTVHPPGERSLRASANDAGKIYAASPQNRTIPPLPENPSADDLVRHALLTNAELEQKYWEWRSAIEQIPQDGTQPTNLVLFAGVPITNGSTAFDRTTVTVANDPMADILWPSKLSVAAQRSLEMARAAGQRFQKARYEVRGKVLEAWYDYVLTTELIRLETENAQLLEAIANTTAARNRAGTGGQQDLLKARNEQDLSRNEIANMQAQLSAQRATLNALLNRAVDASLPAPTTPPSTQPVEQSDAELLDLAARRNPELLALADELRGKQQAIRLANLQYLPDFSASVGTDLAGTAQNLMGMITVPLLRYQAINAAIAQAEGNLRAVESMRQQMRNDLAARVVADIATLRDADRQLNLFEHTILPRAGQVVTIARSAYEANRASLLDVLDSERSLITIQRLVIGLRVARAKRLADLEAAIASALQSSGRFVEERSAMNDASGDR
jgi:outer membrane protein TolC